MKNKFKIVIILLVPMIIGLNYFLRSYPELVEAYYTNGVNQLTRQGLSLITSIAPFSIGEILVISLLIILIVLLILLIIKIKRGKFKIQLLNIVAYLSTIYILFMVLWGFNYDRLSFDKIVALKIQEASESQLYSLCEDLIKRANILRGEVNEDKAGVMTVTGGYKTVFKTAEKGYKTASVRIKELDGKYGAPKPIFISGELCYTGITGIYIPFTGEANVNVNIPDLMLPVTAAHEMAHQRGFAREDEANYIAYLTCSMHPDFQFRYSGVMLALINSMNALADEDIGKYKELTKRYSDGVKRDIKNESVFWQKYSGKIEKVSSNINDSYLKTNGQKDGIKSYGKMVDLLLAEFKGKKSWIMIIMN